MGLSDELKNLLNRTVTYSSSGGANGFIQLFKFDNGSALWMSWWWEIWQRGKLIACANDDDTPITGKMAQDSAALVGKRLLGINIDNDYTLGLFFEDDYDFWIFTDNKPDEKNLYDDFYYWEYWNRISKTAYGINSNREAIAIPFDE